jgi:hypothetical protein
MTYCCRMDGVYLCNDMKWGLCCICDLEICISWANWCHSELADFEVALGKDRTAIKATVFIPLQLSVYIVSQ